ncbi:hypothetical protein [Nocardia brevicatena]|uniref:hypothetical protein n=1 Tax=Nocardia brevicatena TaxID=37327 RepID=UPI0002EE1578|nr:hypothetical protein [Nocardia brevicatena]
MRPPRAGRSGAEQATLAVHIVRLGMLDPYVELRPTLALSRVQMSEEQKDMSRSVSFGCWASVRFSKDA